MSNIIKKELVSVVIPTYNRAEFLPRILNSVWTQDYRPIELIVVSDGSTDNTVDFFENWKNNLPEDTNFSCKLICKENSGGCATRNLGLKNATGEFIQFMDDDDEFFPNAFSSHVKNLRENINIDASLGNIVYSFIDGKVFCPNFEPFSEKNRIHYMKNPPTPNGILFRHKFIKDNAILWDEKLKFCQDTDFMVRAFILGLKLKLSKTNACKIYIHDGERVSSAIRTKNGAYVFFNLVVNWYRFTQKHNNSLSLKNKKKIFTHFFEKAFFVAIRYNEFFLSKEVSLYAKTNGYKIFHIILVENTPVIFRKKIIYFFMLIDQIEGFICRKIKSLKKY